MQTFPHNVQPEIFYHKFVDDDTLPKNVKQKLMDVFDKYKQLNDEDKKKFHKGAIDAVTKALRKVPDKTILPSWLVLWKPYIPFIFVTSCVMLLLVISRGVFRYMWEREQRHKEKKKLRKELKQQKKAEAKLRKAKKKKQ
ncbi:hypothetical protein CAJAP_08033 [Camponotus japonicus]